VRLAPGTSEVQLEAERGKQQQRDHNQGEDGDRGHGRFSQRSRGSKCRKLSSAQKAWSVTIVPIIRPSTAIHAIARSFLAPAGFHPRRYKPV
jgi:hypothetical protein